MVNINKKILISILTILVLFLSSNVFADDFAITNALTSDIIKAGNDFNVSIVLSNNSNTDETIDLNLLIYSPNSVLVSERTENVTVPANSSKTEVINYTWGSDIDTNGSINSHVFFGKITNDPADGANPNNVIKKYIVISKADKTTPVPDMPIIFSLILGLGVVYFFTNSKIAKEEK